MTNRTSRRLKPQIKMLTRAQALRNRIEGERSRIRGEELRRRWREQQASRRNSAIQTWRKMYRPSDPHKRHRLHDSQPKTQRVVSYTRRT